MTWTMRGPDEVCPSLALLEILGVVKERLGIGSAWRKRRVGSEAPIVIAEDGIDRTRVVLARREQIVEQEPVAVGMIGAVLAEGLAVSAIEREADMAAAVVDQVAGEQDDIRRLRARRPLRLAVDLDEVLVVVVEGKASKFAFSPEIFFIHVGADGDMGIGHVGDVERTALALDEDRVQDLGHAPLIIGLLVGRVQRAVVVLVFVEKEAEMLRPGRTERRAPRPRE